MVGPDVDDRIELVAKRIDFLEALADAPQHKPGLVESLGHSRSTVDRAIRRLESVGFVERTDEGFRATLAGRRAAERYRAFLAEMTTVLDGAEFLGSLPPDCDLPLDAVRAGRAGEFATPSRAFEAVVEPLRTADRYVAFLPRLRDSRHLRLCTRASGLTGWTRTCWSPRTCWNGSERSFLGSRRTSLWPTA